MNIHEDNWYVSTEITLKEQEILHLHLKAAGFVIHPYIGVYNYNRDHQKWLCHTLAHKMDRDITILAHSNLEWAHENNYIPIEYGVLLELLKERIKSL